MEQVNVLTPSGSYQIYIGINLWEQILAKTWDFSKTAVVTDDAVACLYGSRLPLPAFVFPRGEQAKSAATVLELAEFMANQALDRDSLLIGLGGGVVGDLAGFAASIYLRGINYLQVPTTLLAMVDSSVGGKTGINLMQGKNLLGTFYQPQAVYINLETLATLPKREIVTGLAEVIKYGIIQDSGLFYHLAEKLPSLKKGEETSFRAIIKRCCEIKAQVVAEDEFEQGLRKILNHGHTIGHALEALTKYQVFTHGEAVLLGMGLEAGLSLELGLLAQQDYHKITALLHRVKPDLALPPIAKEELILAMGRDKKNRGNKISFILPTRIGAVQEVLLTASEIDYHLGRILAKCKPTP